MKIVNINSCYICPNATSSKRGMICNLTSETIPYFTNENKQILDSCLLPDALTRKEVDYIKRKTNK